MATRISGKQTAARITAVVTAGGIAAAGLGFVALQKAPTSAAATPASSLSQNSEMPQVRGSSQDDDASQTPDAARNDEPSATTHVKKTIVRQQSKSAASPVSPGNGGSTSGKSSGS